VVDVDMQIIDDAEENYGVRADLARSDWHYDCIAEWFSFILGRHLEHGWKHEGNG